MIVYKRADYPLIDNWYLPDWNPDTGKNKDLGRSVRHLEHEDGSSITKDESSQMRELARRVMNQVHQSNPSAVPASWSHAGIDLVQEMSKQLRLAHPLFGYCDGDWKVKPFMKEFYPDWIRGHKAEKKIKEEPDSHLDTTDNDSRKRKRLDFDSDNTPKNRKTTKIEDNSKENRSGRNAKGKGRAIEVSRFLFTDNLPANE